ncbi:hypothetical protein KM043_015602 [Ampulex compressa]|nr:hypothetical protein KM043_015602 [Ampulex compressa]
MIPPATTAPDLPHASRSTVSKSLASTLAKRPPQTDRGIPKSGERRKGGMQMPRLRRIAERGSEGDGASRGVVGAWTGLLKIRRCSLTMEFVFCLKHFLFSGRVWLVAVERIYG